MSGPDDSERGERDQAWVAQGRRRRLAQALAWLAVPAAIVVALVIVGGNGGGGSGGGGIGGFRDEVDDPTSSARARDRGYPARTPPVPPKQISTMNYTSAAKAARCRLEKLPTEGQRTDLLLGERVPSLRGPRHVKGTVDYKSNPPTSGEHSAIRARDGNYAGRPSPPPEQYVHSLELGSVVVQYEPGTAQRTIGRLQRLLVTPTWSSTRGDYVDDGEFALLLENTTGMRYAVAATAWGRLLGCPTVNDRIYDAIRAFRTQYMLNAPARAAGELH